jgi:hypothetical protein
MKRAFGWAIAAYLVPTFPLGYLWHLVTFGARYERLGMYRAEVVIPLGLLSMAVQAVIFAWAYPRLFSTRRDGWVGSAARFGAVFALLAWSFTTLPVAAKYRMTSVPDFLLLETAFTLVQFLLVAPLVALAYREPATAATSSGSRAGALRSSPG